MSKPSHISEASTSRSASPPPPHVPLDPNVEAFVSLISYPVQDTSSERLVRWKAVDESPTYSAFFHLFDCNRRVEIRQSGVFRLHLYLEPVDADVSKYYLEVNGAVLLSRQALSSELTDSYRQESDCRGSSSSKIKSLFGSKSAAPVARVASATTTSSSSSSSSSSRLSSSGRHRSSSSDDAPIRTDVALKAANVFEVRLTKWDMVVVRRKSNWLGQYGGRTAFGRFLLQAMRS